MGEIDRPAPLSTVECTQNAAANEISTEYEKGEDRLVAGLHDPVGQPEPRSVTGDVVVVDKKHDLPVGEQDENRGEGTHGVEGDGCLGLWEGYWFLGSCHREVTSE